PLYFLGHKMLRWYPYVPIGGEMAVNCAILSYDGKVYFGFSGDVHAVPDLVKLESFLKTSFAEMQKSAGVSDSKKGQATPKKRRAAAAAPVPSPDDQNVSSTQPRPIPPRSVPSRSNIHAKPAESAHYQSAFAAAGD